MGKEGIAVVRKYFRDAGVVPGDAGEAARYCLENYRFMYPDENQVSESVSINLFCSFYLINPRTLLWIG